MLDYPDDHPADSGGSMDIDSYIENRVDSQLRYYGDAADTAKRRHVWTQTLIIVLGVTVPVVVNLPSLSPAVEIGSRVATTILSLALAILTGIANFRRFGDLWLNYRMAEEALKQEKFLFQTRSGDYAERDTAFRTFVLKTESIVSAEQNKFRALLEEQHRVSKGGSGASV